MEAVQIQLTGKSVGPFDIYYRVYCQKLGWLGWAKNGETAGSTGCSLRMEAIQIKIVTKGSKAPGDTTLAFVMKPDVSYKVHVQNFSWLPYVKNGEAAGLIGDSKRIEALYIALADLKGGSGVKYRALLKDVGWTSWVTSDKLVGTTGQGRQMEAVQIQLTGYNASCFNIYYRVKVEQKGWLGWAKNGEKAGTENGGLRMEAIEIVMVLKGASFNQGGTAYYDLTPAPKSTPIPASETYYVTTTAGLILRTGPGTGYSKILIMPYAGSMQVSSITNGWAQVNYNGYNGYCSANYISSKQSDTNEARVRSRLDEIINGQLSYNSSTVMKVGSKFTGYRANEQCKGYAKNVFYLLFKVNIGSTQSKPNNYLLNSGNGYILSKTSANMTAASAKDLFEDGRPGDFIQIRRGHTGSHSAILYAKSDAGVTFLEANLDNNNKVSLNQYTWNALAKSNAAMSRYTAESYCLK